ncbi:penicillin-binding protein 1A [Rhizomicrobium palustre]|uniref:Penicillin-binding protein 1A n=1 Tax=Rhizomicrobium palustre TaxID=189966 RepID=A0A846N1D4_9PROT|nr:penicillin-binding protein 1A [Rhizomicrobium palustre]NIK89403.1 penicillin-binding protein 1A [Rhizomicrobium palustre]
MSDTQDEFPQRRSSQQPRQPGRATARPEEPWDLPPPDGFGARHAEGGEGEEFDFSAYDEAPPPPKKGGRGGNGGGGGKGFKKPWLHKLAIYAALGAGVFIGVIVLSVMGWIWWVTRDLPSVKDLQNYTPPVTTRVYAGDGTLLGEYARERRVFVPIAFVPKLVINAFTSAEDRNFYSHPGIDPSGMLRAAIKDIGKVMVGQRPHGASTITQQVARTFKLNADVKMARKFREIFLAMRLESTYSKDKILELYLNQINLGQNSYGVGAAALNYFGKSLGDLTISEAAFLAALPKAPSHYDPRFHPEAARDRRNWVIGQMEENGYITHEQAEAAKAEPLNASNRPLGSQTQDANYFVEEVRRQLYTRYGGNQLYDNGLQVRASLDTRLQNYAVNALRMGLVRYDRRHGWRGATKTLDVSGDWKTALKGLGNHSGIETWDTAVVLGYRADKSVRIGLVSGQEASIPFKELAWARPELKNAEVGASPAKPQDALKIGDVIYVEPVDSHGNFGLRQVPEVNGGIVALDPHTGRVLALSGGFSYESSQYDRAMQALRQPGSTFKPFVYAAALDNGFTPVAKVLDAPFCMQQGPGMPMWCPENFEKHFIGLATLRRGIVLSKNLMTVRLAQAVGMDKITPIAERFGVYNKLDPLLANALGSTGTTLLRMTTGFAEFVNGGKKITPSLVDQIQDRDGKTIWRHDDRKCEGCNSPDWNNQAEPLLEDKREQIMDPRTAYQIVSMLQGVVQYGTGASVSVIGKPIAGKTGTSNDSRDVWFIGFSPDLAAGVYVGFDNPRTLGQREQGATVAAPIFRDFMKGALETKPATPFRVPPGIELIPVDRLTGNLVPAGTPGSIQEAFKAGTAPGEPGAAPTMVIGGDQPATTATQGQAPGVEQGTGGLY